MSRNRIVARRRLGAARDIARSMALALAPVDGDDLHRLRKTSQHDAARSRSWHLAVCDGGDTGQDLAAGRELGDASGLVHAFAAERAARLGGVRGMQTDADLRREPVLGAMLREPSLD